MKEVLHTNLMGCSSGLRVWGLGMVAESFGGGRVGKGLFWAPNLWVT